MATNERIAGTSNTTPTIEASAAPECRPSRLIATAKANPKQLGLRMSAHGVIQQHAEEDKEAHLNAQVVLKRADCEHPFTATASHSHGITVRIQSHAPTHRLCVQCDQSLP
jgi:hypothetical protein